MAKIVRRKWTSRGPLGERVRHVAYGYTLMVNGKRERRWSSAWITDEEARKALEQRREDIKNGHIAPSPHRDVLLGELVEEYLKYKADEGKLTVKDDKNILDNKIVPAFGAHLPIRILDKTMISNYRKRRTAEVSANTIRNELGILHHMLNLAHEWGYLKEVPTIKRPKPSPNRERYLTEDEIERLLKACAHSRNPYLVCIVTLAINTGMRSGEILGLAWERVNLEADYGFNAKITLYRTKNGKPRSVALNPAAYEALATLEPNPERRRGPVFTRRNGQPWGNVDTAFRSALKSASIEDCTFHDLRHTAASHLVMRGRSLREVQDFMGHKDIRMTVRYAHLSPAHLRATAEALNGLTPSAKPDELSHRLAQNAKPEYNAVASN